MSNFESLRGLFEREEFRVTEIRRGKREMERQLPSANAEGQQQICGAHGREHFLLDASVATVFL